MFLYTGRMRLSTRAISVSWGIPGEARIALHSARDRSGLRASVIVPGVAGVGLNTEPISLYTVRSCVAFQTYLSVVIAEYDTGSMPLAQTRPMPELELAESASSGSCCCSILLIGVLIYRDRLSMI
jgi:hypothetical protein